MVNIHLLLKKGDLSTVQPPRHPKCWPGGVTHPVVSPGADLVVSLGGVTRWCHPVLTLWCHPGAEPVVTPPGGVTWLQHILLHLCRWLCADEPLSHIVPCAEAILRLIHDHRNKVLTFRGVYRR